MSKRFNCKSARISSERHKKSAVMTTAKGRANKLSCQNEDELLQMQKRNWTETKNRIMFPGFDEIYFFEEVDLISYDLLERCQDTFGVAHAS